MKRFILIATIFLAPVVKSEEEEMKLISVDHQEQFTVIIKGKKFEMTRSELSDLVDEADKALGTRVNEKPSEPCTPGFIYHPV